MQGIKDFKNVIAILDNDFGNLRIIKDNDNNVYINDVDLTNSAKNLLRSIVESNSKLFLLIREKENLDTNFYEQIDTFLSYDSGKPNIIKSIPFNDNLEQLLIKLEKEFLLNQKETIFISSDRSSRHISLKRGYYALPHPKVVNMILKGKSLRFVRIVVNGSDLDEMDQEDILPYYFEQIDNNNNTYDLLAIISNEILNMAIENKMEIQILNVDLSYEDIINVNLEVKLTKETIEETTNNYGFLLLENNKMIITVSEKKIANIPLHGRHGHFIQLIPDDTLLYKFKNLSQLNKKSTDYIFKKLVNIVKSWPIENVKFKSLDNIFSEFLKIKLDSANPNSILNDIKRYSGEIDLDSKGKIVSRHCLHPDNGKSILALESDLKQMGYFVKVWEFQADDRPPGVPSIPNVEGATFYNVIAELPGVGANLFLENDLSSKVRDIFLKYPNPLQDESWIYEIKMLLGDEWFEKNNLQSLNALDLKRKLEGIFGLEQWSHWWIKDKDKPGLGSEIIIIGCHLDSTANILHIDESGRPVINRDYDPKISIAPGADDDGSGLAATLELARVFSKLKNKLTHTIQFCFFNSEEVGLRGSLEYAKYMRRIDAPITAVLCMDMIGYNKEKSNRTFEIHAGHSNSEIRDSCLPLAKYIGDSAESLGKLGKAQIYKGLSWGTGLPDEADREKYDGAIRRSDHWSFQTHGYPAVLVSEDFFINISTLESKADANPQYHQLTDKATEIDQSYAADIASSVALTVKKIAEI
jgi:hypothetical protein